MSDNPSSNSIPDPVPMERVIDGLQYRTGAGRRIAYDWRPGYEFRYYSTAYRLHLFVTPRGNYFCQEQETEPDSNEAGRFAWIRLRTLTRGEALWLYHEAKHKLLGIAEAFPGEIEA